MKTETSNRLANEKSPYLLQHAHNPVNWFPWGEEAFEKARREEKPIFLSIGYSTCHWCHVMAHESFENDKIAQILNEHYVAIKVDREERPDVDRVYMTFVQATTGSGGWPMSVFLTPELKPFVGGTYFPPEDRYGRPGFPTVLHRIAEAWEKNRAQVIEQGNQLTNALREHASSGSETTAAPDDSAIKAGYEQIARGFDAELGGFGSAPKFPRPVTLNFLFRVFARDPDSPKGKHALEMNLLTLRKMAEGGMHDQLGGGFHRYSVDAGWHVPHFEKMLYDQAQLAISYLEAFQITRDPFYETVARDILDYVRRDMTAHEGGFFSAEDADSLFEQGKPEHGEGVFYVWTREEIEHALGEEKAKIFDRYFGVEEGGNAPAGSDPQGEFRGKNILIQRHTVEEVAKIYKKEPNEVRAILADGWRKLFELRATRPRPHLDDKIITAWNGMMISAFARAAQVLGDTSYLDAATSGAKFLRAQNFNPTNGSLLRSYRQGRGTVSGFADDYAFLVAGLLDLYETSADIEWLKWAGELQRKQDELFADSVGGGYFSAPADDPHILLRMKEDYDGAEPSPNSVAAMNLLRLAEATGEEKLRERAEKTIAAFSEQIDKIPSAMPQMLVALDFLHAKKKQIVIAGKPDSPETRALLSEVHSHFLPNKILLFADGAAGQQWLGERLKFLKSIAPNEKATAFVCEDFVCQLPTSDAAKLREQLTRR
ncbi:MAG: thioredoxin domain-containing protein [Verrucomicrobiota bacterium]|nr:thioredoxin domain-containing protein [Verrucomicrobiota bacterium]